MAVDVKKNSLGEYEITLDGKCIAGGWLTMISAVGGVGLLALGSIVAATPAAIVGGTMAVVGMVGEMVDLYQGHQQQKEFNKLKQLNQKYGASNANLAKLVRVLERKTNSFQKELSFLKINRNFTYNAVPNFVGASHFTSGFGRKGISLVSYKDSDGRNCEVTLDGNFDLDEKLTDGIVYTKNSKHPIAVVTGNNIKYIHSAYKFDFHLIRRLGSTCSSMLNFKNYYNK